MTVDPTTARADVRPKWRRIHDELRDAIEAGRILPGDRIPTEQELCQVYDASRTSVRRALRELGLRGLLEARRPAGTFVTDNRP